MLKVIFGDCEEAIYNTSIYFDNQYLDSWIETEFARKVIKGIDRGEILSSHAIDTKALGIIPVTKISGGTKTVLLIENQPDHIFNASTCGDNCARYILDIGRRKDVTINLRHIMDFGKRKFSIYIVNEGIEVHSMAELVEVAVKYV